MRIVHVTRSLIVNSGVSVFVAELASSQAEFGHEVHLRYTWLPDYPIDPKVDSRAFKSLDELEFVPDVVHIHAFWSIDMMRAMNWCRKHGIPYIVSPHGGLMPRVFTKGWLRKHLFYQLFLRKNLQCAQAIHCTGEGEVVAVKALGLRVPVVVAPLGCHLPEWPVEKSPSDSKTVLFLSRISEEKGLVYLLDAWKAVPHDGWRLIIAGPDCKGHLNILREKIQAEDISGVEFTGAADVKLKDMLYRTADLFVLPSPMENFSMVTLDALAYGVPVICTRGTPWRILEEAKCGWWIKPNDSGALADALREAMSCSRQEAEQKGLASRKIAERYSWRSIGGALAQEYTSASK